MPWGMCPPDICPSCFLFLFISFQLYFVVCSFLFLVYSSKFFVFCVQSFLLLDFWCSVSTWTCGRNRDHDRNGRYTQSETATSRSTGTTGHVRRANFHVAPPPLICVLWRVGNTVRFLKACLFATLVFLRRSFTERRRAVHSPRGHGVTAVPRPAPLAKREGGGGGTLGKT